MKVVSLRLIKKPAHIFTFFLLMSFVFSLAVVPQTGQARQAQLSLADILIGLRSRKVTLAERNTLLTDAVKKRGITFTLTPEIEKELASTGAGSELIEAIRLKSPKIFAPPATPTPTPTPAPAPTPVAPVYDFAFYQKRASAHLNNKEYDLAVTEFNKAIELNPKDAPTFVNRGLAFLNQKNYERAIADFDKAIEINPKESKMYFDRGDLHEKLGNAEKALSDYQKAFELDPANETAKANLQRLQNERAKALAKTTNQAAASEPEAPAAQQIVNVGALNELAINLAVPIYTAIDRQRNLQGIVTVQVVLDEKGKVVSAKATAGPVLLRSTSEAAALKSKFKPATVGNQAVRSTGFINYNFKAN
jgi:tetratricopeptide (TPR) repeat protein